MVLGLWGSYATHVIRTPCYIEHVDGAYDYLALPITLTHLIEVECFAVVPLGLSTRVLLSLLGGLVEGKHSSDGSGLSAGCTCLSVQLVSCNSQSE